jgi:signal transduction histidine kinase
MEAMRSDDYGGPGKLKNFETRFRQPLEGGSPGRHFRLDPLRRQRSRDRLDRFRQGHPRDPRKDRLATLGEVAVALCHEINSPLEVILNEVELLEAFVRKRATDAEAVVEEERLDAVRREVLKIQAIVNQLVLMSRGGKYGTASTSRGSR